MSVPQDQLAPCPFCGGIAQYERMGTQRVSCIISCTECGCSLETGEVFTCGRKWNTRVSIERALADRETVGQSENR